MFNILILCTGNSARSILAEALFHRDGKGRVTAFSAGSNPVGQVNTRVTSMLERRGLETSGYRSKSWDEFSGPGAPPLDLVITVCDSAAKDTCPIWPGKPLETHWGVPDPAAAPADQIDLAFQAAYHRLSARVNAFLALPFETMKTQELMPKLAKIGEL